MEEAPKFIKVPKILFYPIIFWFIIDSAYKKGIHALEVEVSIPHEPGPRFPEKFFYPLNRSFYQNETDHREAYHRFSGIIGVAV
jgi:hypothetical protein